MAGRIWFAAILIVLSACRTQDAWTADAELSGPTSWMTDYGKARAESRRTGLPLIVHFHARWCGPCRQMEREFLGTSAMKAYLGRRFIGVKLDSDREPGLVEAFRVTGLPADIIVAPDGKILVPSTQGRRSRGQYFAALDRVEKDKSGVLGPLRQAAIARHQAAGDSPRSNDSKTKGSRQGAVARRQEKKPSPLIGLEGYSPVRIREARQWVKGQKALSSTWKGIVYYFVNQKELDRFRAAPHKFAPRMLGCDPVELWKTDRAVQGSVQYGAFYDGDLYLFVSADSRTEFKKNPVRYSRMRHAIRSDAIRRTQIQ